jgi:hydrogenase nickel incorporation protein HypB
MCASCGCGDSHIHVYEELRGHGQTHPGHAHSHDHHDHAHGHPHSHEHEHGPAVPRTVTLEQEVLAKNNAQAARNRQAFEAARVATFNLTSSPGAGKTSLLEAVIERLDRRVPLAVVEGDQETERDADRIRARGARAVQINTRQGCHLDADMVERAVGALGPAQRWSLLLIENVGNLVCPALFDLGERAKIVLMSVTEGEDKPLKYPHMFRAARILVLTKIDLLPHLELDLDVLRRNALRVNPGLRIFEVSARDGSGLPAFVDWLAAEATREAAA